MDTLTVGQRFCLENGISYQPANVAECFQTYEDRNGYLRSYYARYAVCPNCGHRNRLARTVRASVERMITHSPVGCKGRLARKRCRETFRATPNWEDHYTRRVYTEMTAELRRFMAARTQSA